MGALYSAVCFRLISRHQQNIPSIFLSCILEGVFPTVHSYVHVLTRTCYGVVGKTRYQIQSLNSSYNSLCVCVCVCAHVHTCVCACVHVCTHVCVIRCCIEFYSIYYPPRLTGAATATVDDLKHQTSSSFQRALKEKKVCMNSPTGVVVLL